MKLTEMQILILICINEYIYENEESPSIRDIAYDLNKSTSTIHFHLKKLKERGLIDFSKKGRSIRLI